MENKVKYLSILLVNFATKFAASNDYRADFGEIVGAAQDGIFCLFMLPHSKCPRATQFSTSNQHKLLHKNTVKLTFEGQNKKV